jgi:two-component system sensor histidine kinase UhpB
MDGIEVLTVGKAEKKPEGMTGDKARILILEHDINDVDLILYELKKSGIPHEVEFASTKMSYELAVLQFCPNVILSDFSLPAFDGMSAFQYRQKMAPDIPFIFVSGFPGEDTFTELLKHGLTDYVMKDKLFMLTFKLLRVLRKD